MKLYEIRKEARESLKGKWGKSVLMILAFTFVLVIIGIISGFMTATFGENEDSLIASLITLATTIILLPIAVGMEFVFIKLKRNEEVDILEFIKVGISNFARIWGISFRIFLKTLLPLIIMAVMIVVSVALFIMSFVSGEPTGFFTSMIIPIILYIPLTIWYYSRILLYSLAFYIAYDNPNMTGKEAVNESAKIMKGNRIKLVLLDLSFIGWILLASLTFGIGYFFLLPYMQMASVSFYESFLENNKKEYSNSEETIEIQ